MKKKRGAMELETIVKLIIAAVVLALSVVMIILLRAKGTGALSFVRRIFGFG